MFLEMDSESGLFVYGQRYVARTTLKHCPEYNWD